MLPLNCCLERKSAGSVQDIAGIIMNGAFTNCNDITLLIANIYNSNMKSLAELE